MYMNVFSTQRDEKEAEVIPYHLQGFAIFAPVVDIIKEESKKPIVDFVNFLVAGKLDLDEMDKNSKLFFETKCKKEMKQLVGRLIVATVPPKLRVIFSDYIGDGSTYYTLVIEGIKSKRVGKVLMK